jgi:hypothetical protein
MADGKAWDRTDCKEVRKEHPVKPRIDTDKVHRFLCECNGFYHEVHHKDGRVTLAHDPGTFWGNDMPRFRW